MGFEESNKQSNDSLDPDLYRYNRGSIERNLDTNGRTLADYEDLLIFDRRELEGKKVLDLGAGQGPIWLRN